MKEGLEFYVAFNSLGTHTHTHTHTNQNFLTSHMTSVIPQ